MKDKLSTALNIQTLAFSVVRGLIEQASQNAAAVIASAVDKYKITDDTIVFHKSYKDTALKVKDEERAVVAKIATGGLGMDGEVILQSGMIKNYFNGVVLYCHDYGKKYLPVGKCVHIEEKNGDLIAVTVFAKHELGEDLYKLYKDDVKYKGKNTGPICQDWSVDYIPLKVLRRSTTGFKTALGKTLQARPDLRPSQDDIQTIVTSWLLLGYSCAPIGMNPEAKTILEGKALSKELILDLQKIEEDGDEETEIIEDKEEDTITIIIEPDAEEETPKAETYNCECIDCGHKMETTEHCRDIECPECGGTMRREERPGPGQDNKEDVSVKEPVSTNDETPESTETDPAPEPGSPAPAINDVKINITVSTEEEDEPEANNDDTESTGGDVGEPVAEEDNEEETEEETQAEDTEDDERLVVVGLRAKAMTYAHGKGLQEAMSYMNNTIPVFMPIDSGTALGIVDYLIAMNLLDSGQELTILINSPGGYVTDSFAITDAMEYVQSKGTKIKTVGMGEIASAGLMIFMAGDERIIAPNASILSHRFSGGVVGSEAELQARTVEWDNVNARMFDHYAKHSKYTDKAEIADNLLRNTDTWLTAKQAIKHKLADKILTDKFQFAEPVLMEEELVEGKAITDVLLGNPKKVHNESEELREELEELKEELYKYTDTLDEMMRVMQSDPDAPSNEEIEEVGMNTGSVSEGETTGGEMITITAPSLSREEIKTEIKSQLSEIGVDTKAAIRAGIRRALGKVD